MNSAKTQISRKTVSAPTRYLLNEGVIESNDSVLHFGEGKAYLDTEAIEEITPWTWAYDPNSRFATVRGKAIMNRAYDVGVSNYVFNTLENKDREEAYLDMFNCCDTMYIAVRTDKVKGRPHPLCPGVITKRGTFQTQLDRFQWLAYFARVSPTKTRVSILHHTSHYCIIKVVKWTY